MPLNGHTYLVGQGWSGHGKGLREGSISRPLAIPQKRTLAGLGKDRDEAFPFWDHLFNAAAKSMQVKVFNDDDDSNTDNDGTPALPELHRTSTGLLSNRRPTQSIPSSSGTATPDTTGQAQGLRLSLFATAKREAAKRGLYARFFRGPVLGPDTNDVEIEEKVTSSSTAIVEQIVLLSGEDDIDNGLEDVKQEEMRKGKKEKKAEKKDKKLSSKSKGKGKEMSARTKDRSIDDPDTTTAKDKCSKRKWKDDTSTVNDDDRGKEERKRKRKRGNDEDLDTTEVGAGDGTSPNLKKEKKRKRHKEDADGEKETVRRKEKEDCKRRKEEKRKWKEDKRRWEESEKLSIAQGDTE